MSSSSMAPASIRAGVSKVIETMATHLGVAPDTAKQRFQAFWPGLEVKVQEALEAAKPALGGKTKQRSMSDMLEEVLTQVRELTRTVDNVSGPPFVRDELIMGLQEVEDLAHDLMHASDPGVVARGERLRMLTHMMAQGSGISPSTLFDPHPPRKRRFPPLERESPATKA
jgi:hypothetical protein